MKAYMNMAREMAKLSPDSETQVGAIMLSSEGRVIASSFNGFARGANDDCLPNKRPDKYQYIQHAERNMLYNCAYEGIRTKGTTIVCTLSPCLECVRACFQSGVKRIVFDELYHKFEGVGFYATLPDIHIEIKNDYQSGFTVLEMTSKKKHEDIEARVQRFREKIIENS